MESDTGHVYVNRLGQKKRLCVRISELCIKDNSVNEVLMTLYSIKFLCLFVITQNGKEVIYSAVGWKPARKPPQEHSVSHNHLFTSQNCLMYLLSLYVTCELFTCTTVGRMDSTVVDKWRLKRQCQNLLWFLPFIDRPLVVKNVSTHTVVWLCLCFYRTMNMCCTPVSKWHLTMNRFVFAWYWTFMRRFVALLRLDCSCWLELILLMWFPLILNWYFSLFILILFCLFCLNLNFLLNLIQFKQKKKYEGKETEWYSVLEHV